mmetsp:Transcript_17622/g.48879  ORF Transcript_17622/g.48879 Transcript_17622/m.48879 type:complete len:230 (-) Transcript_17622:2455-3144(-)
MNLLVHGMPAADGGGVAGEEAGLRALADTGGVVFATVLDGAASKVQKSLSKLQLKNMPIVVAALDITEKSCREAWEKLGSIGGDAGAKKSVGLIQSVLKTMRSLTPEVPRTEITRDPDHPPIDDWLLGPGREAALKWLKVAMTERKKALHEFRGPPSGQLLVLMFVTMVGWGKVRLKDNIFHVKREVNDSLSSAANVDLCVDVALIQFSVALLLVAKVHLPSKMRSDFI